jgi:hypothetical protein
VKLSQEDNENHARQAENEMQCADAKVDEAGLDGAKEAVIHYGGGEVLAESCAGFET